MHIAVGTDEKTHLTDFVAEDLKKRGHEVEFYGPAQWPDVAREVAEKVASGAAEQGVLFCWTGTGVSIVANKIPGIRAALCWDAETARGARKWDGANLLCLSLRYTSEIVAKEILDAWLGTTEIDPTEVENIEKVKRMDEALSKGSVFLSRTVARKQREATIRIQKILSQRESVLSEQVASVQDVRELPRSVRERIVAELGNEFSEKGLRPDFEPNAYGLEIEDLIDACALAEVDNS